MGKTYLDIVKYMIEARFTINGFVDKPDIIGAVFGQTEGLLGDELDLRELQKNGKIGRIERDLQQNNNRSVGKLHLPASLDRIETCILAASIEAVDRVGPYECQFIVDKVEDTRTEKRRKIVDRAKELVKKLLATGMPDSRELAEKVQSEVKSNEIIAYGPEQLPAGPDIERSEEIILVEGRADVLNLLRYDITNTIAVGGATNKIPATIVKLSKEKETTMFADGDRGGDMIIRFILSVADIDYVAKAPEGTEVEELQRKEVIKALRTKIPIDQYMAINKYPPRESQKSKFVNQVSNTSLQQAQAQAQQNVARAPVQETKPAIPKDDADSNNVEIKDLRDDADDDNKDVKVPKISYAREEQHQQKDISKAMYQDLVPGKAQAPNGTKPALDSIVLSQLGKGLAELSDTLRSRLYNQEGEVMKEVPIRELLATIQDTDGAYGIVLDGIITQRLIELALQKNIKALYGIRANPMPRKHPELIIYTKEQGKME